MFSIIHRFWQRLGLAFTPGQFQVATIDALENRCLLSSMIVRIPHPHGIFAGRIDTPELAVVGRNAYVTDPAAAEIARVSPRGQVQLFQYGSKVAPVGIVASTDGSVWFEDGNSDRVGKLGPDGKTTFFTINLPDASEGAFSSSLVPGANGSMWDPASFQMAHVSANGAVQVISLNDFEGNMEDFVVDPTGNAWFITGGELGLGEIAPDQVGRISPSGKVLDVPLGTIDPQLLGIGPGGTLYFYGIDSTTNANLLGTISADGTITSAPVSFSVSDMFTAKDGSLYLTTSDGLAHVTSGLQAPIVGVSGIPSYSSQASDGAFWYSTGDANQLGRVTPGGEFSEFTVPASPDSPTLTGVAADNFGNVWGVSGDELFGDKGVLVTRIDLHTVLLATGTSSPVSAGPATQVATVTDFSAAAVAGDFTASVKWPDGTTSPGTIEPAGHGLFNITSAAGHAMADGSAAVTVRDTRDGRVATTSIAIAGNLPTPVGTPINIQVSAGMPFTLPMGDFSDVVLQAASTYNSGIGWDASPSAPFGVGAGDGDGEIEPDGHGGLEVVATHVFFSPGTFPVTINLGAFSNGANNNSQVTSIVTVVPDTNPDDVVLQATLTPLPVSDFHLIPYAMSGAADLTPLLGVDLGTMNFTGRQTSLNKGGTLIQLTFRLGRSSISLKLNAKSTTDMNHVFSQGICKLVSATGALAHAKPILHFTLLEGTDAQNEYILLT